MDYLIAFLLVWLLLEQRPGGRVLLKKIRRWLTR
jgi:hypothetical protein